MTKTLKTCGTCGHCSVVRQECGQDKPVKLWRLRRNLGSSGCLIWISREPDRPTVPDHFPVEVKNLIGEIETWVTEKDQAIIIASVLMTKFNITPQDFVDLLRELKGG